MSNSILTAMMFGGCLGVMAHYAQQAWGRWRDHQAHLAFCRREIAKAEARLAEVESEADHGPLVVDIWRHTQALQRFVMNGDSSPEGLIWYGKALRDYSTSELKEIVLALYRAEIARYKHLCGAA